MAYTSDLPGRNEVYVRPFPAGDRKWKISIAGGEQPRWRGDGKELFFVGADGKMIAVAAKAGAGASPSFEPGPPQPLFEAHVDQSPVVNDLFENDVTADGKRFLLNTVVGSASAPVLTVVSNWAAGQEMTPDRFRRLEELYHSVRERGAAVLADADPDLRREVGSLLAQDPAHEGCWIVRPPVCWRMPLSRH